MFIIIKLFIEQYTLILYYLYSGEYRREIKIENILKKKILNLPFDEEISIYL